MSDPRLGWVEALIALSEFKKVSAAASALGVGETTLIRDIEQLQEWAGRILLLNDQLTSDGARFAREAASIWTFAAFVDKHMIPDQDRVWALQRAPRSTIRLSDLKAFAAIAEGDMSTYNKAGEKLACSGSALWKSMARLEARVGPGLLAKKGNLLLTVAGSQLHVISKQVIIYFSGLTIYPDESSREKAELRKQLDGIRESISLQLHNAEVFICGSERTRRLSTTKKIKLLSAKSLVQKWKTMLEELDGYLGKRLAVRPYYGEVPA